MAAAASPGVRTPLRLAGDASASRWTLLGPLLGRDFLLLLLDLAQGRVREALAHQEDHPDADSDGRLDHLQADAEGKAVAVGDAVVRERNRDGDLDEPEVPRPEREDRRDVHEDEDEAGGGQREMDVERLHRGPDGEQ